MSEFDGLPDLTYLCKQLHESLQLPVYCEMEHVTAEEAIWAGSLPAHPSSAEPIELFRSIVRQGMDLNRPVYLVTESMEQFIVLPVARDGRRHAVVVIGPAVRHKLSGELCDSLLNDYGIPHSERPEWLEYWNRLPVMNRLRMLHIAVMSNWMLQKETLDITDVHQSFLHLHMPKQEKGKMELALADRFESHVLHSGLDLERRMLAFIRSGDKSGLMKLLSTDNLGEAPVLAKRSQLRNMKNIAIGAIAVSMRAAIDGGLYEEVAYALCDLYIQHVEELTSSRKVEGIVLQALLDFAERVGQCRKNRVSRPVHDCMAYIYSHLFEEITAQQLSEVAGLHPQYLSKLFKKETGMSVMNYIQGERIQEAKKLLDNSSDPISTIGTRLTFYDQAHFVKVFKKHAGMTPKEYRNRIQRDE